MKKALMLSLLLLFSCFNESLIPGSGTLQNNQHRLDGTVENVESTLGAGKLTVLRGDRQTLRIRTDDNIIRHVRYRLANKTLKLFTATDQQVVPTELAITLTLADTLQGLNLQGTDITVDSGFSTAFSDIVLEDSDAQNLTAHRDSCRFQLKKSSLSLKGRSTVLDARLDSSSAADLTEFRCEDAELLIGNSAVLCVWAQRQIRCSIGAHGRLEYIGTPQVITHGCAQECTITQITPLQAQ
ncbi:MAG: GIN domain-containing protein [Fibrobacterota bacterium]